MSELQVTAQGRLDSFEDAKRANDEENRASEIKQYADAAYGDAGVTDFSDEAKNRLEEQAVYEAYMEKFTTDERDSLDRHIDAIDAGDVKPKDDARLRRITMLQEDIARMEAEGSGQKVADEATGKTVIEYRKERLAELQDEYDKGVIREKVAAKTVEIATTPEATSATKAVTAIETVTPVVATESKPTAITPEVAPVIKTDVKPKKSKNDEPASASFDESQLNPEQKQRRHDDMVKIWQNASNNERHQMLKLAYGEKKYKNIDHNKVDKLSDPVGMMQIVQEAFNNGYKYGESTGGTRNLAETKQMPVSNVDLTGAVPLPKSQRSKERQPEKEQKILGIVEKLGAMEEADDGNAEEVTDQSEFIDDKNSAVRKFYNKLKSGFNVRGGRKEKARVAAGMVFAAAAGVGAWVLLKDHSAAQTAADIVANNLPPSTGGAGGEVAEHLIDHTNVPNGGGIISLLADNGIAERAYFDQHVGDQIAAVAPDWVEKINGDWRIKAPGPVPEAVQRVIAGIQK